jgi:hypothetical protein
MSGALFALRGLCGLRRGQDVPCFWASTMGKAFAIDSRAVGGLAAPGWREAWRGLAPGKGREILSLAGAPDRQSR